MERLTSRENAAIKDFCKLISSKKKRELTGKFAIESLKLVLEAYQNGVRIEKVFLTAQAIEKYREKLFELLNSGIPVFEITDELSRKMTETESPQGVFAICEKLDKTLLPDKIENNSVLAALSDLQDPGNIGTVFRTAEALGIQGILVSETCCDIYNPKVLRASMGAVFRVPFWISSDFGADLKRLSARGLTTYAAVVDKTARSLTEISYHGGVAVIGNEGNGLTREIIDCCDEKITIQMKGNAESLNAAMAAGIIFWQMTLDSF